MVLALFLIIIQYFTARAHRWEFPVTLLNFFGLATANGCATCIDDDARVIRR